MTKYYEFYEAKLEARYEPAGYKLAEGCGPIWTFLWKHLIKWGVVREYISRTNDVKIHRFKTNDLAEMIDKQLMTIGGVYKQDIAFIMIGRREMEKLMMDATRGVVSIRPGGYKYEGIEVRCVPWLDGVVVVPKK